MSDDRKRPANLLETPLSVVNLGLEGFAQDLEQHGVAVMRVDWSPPARGDARLADLLSKLDG